MQKGNVRIRYQEVGAGFPIMVIHGGGQNSTAGWGATGAPFNSMEEFKNEFRLIAADLRNAHSGESTGPLEADHGWHTYTQDHLALMDHLGHQRFHTLGGCIGGSYCINIAEMAPNRTVTTVLQNPIGLHPEHPEYFPDSHKEWTKELLAKRRDLDEAKMVAFGKNMGHHEFVFCSSREFVKKFPMPAILLPGTDIPHPAATSDELIALLPGLEVVKDWRGPEHMDTQRDRVVAFLKRHTPG